MRALVQRVSRASVSVAGRTPGAAPVAQIGAGLAAPGTLAEPLYERFCTRAQARRGRFGAHMCVELVNDGPVTLLLES